MAAYVCLQGQGHGATIFQLLVRDADRMEGATKVRVGAPPLGSPWVLQPLTFSRI